VLIFSRNYGEVLVKLFIVFTFCIPAVFAWAGEMPHPSVVDPSTAKCELCHEELLKGKVHPIVEEGCTNCHEMSKKEGKTVVSLMMEGNDLCTMCHAEMEDVFERSSMHGAVEDCLNCHVPHASETDHLMKATLPDLCMECHDRDELKTRIHKGQPVHATNCILCHDPHGNNRPHMLTGKVQHPPFAESSCEACHRATRTKKARLIVKEPDLCYACHGDLPDKFNGTSIHGPVKEGTCTKCHDPHQSPYPKLLDEKGSNLCFECHKEIKVLVEAKAHSPAKEDCFSCHGVHATGRPHLLLEDMMPEDSIASLCGSCHDLDDLKGKHRGAKMESLDCTGCHNPHGSKDGKLLQTTSVHPVFEDCDNCHTEGTKLMEEDPDLCAMCHDDVAEKASKAKVAHPVMEMGCTNCHTPHVSREAHLFKGPQVEVCGACHSMEYTVYHGVIESVGCQACHEPHGGNGETLLKVAGNGLCLQCHDKEAKVDDILSVQNNDVKRISLDPQKRMGHPILKHPVSGEVFDVNKVKMPKEIKSLGCLSCHNPHGGSSGRLYAANKESYNELCAMCHSK